MRDIKRLIISVTACMLAFSAVSCMKENNTLRYNNATMGNGVDGAFISDQGNRFNVTEQTCPGKLDTMKRAFVICDVLNNTEGAENEFDVRLNYIADVLTKETVPVSDAAGMESYRNDPLLITDLWISGGYLNLYISFPIVRTSGKVHEINLIHDMTEEKDGTYKFIMRHDAQEEVLKLEGDNGRMVLAYAYVSFPISSVIKEDTAKIILEWNGYVVMGNGVVSAQTDTYQVVRNYVKSSFEQVPPTVAANISEVELQ